MSGDDVKILLVEDDEVDVLTIERALKKKRVVNDLAVAKDGIEALELLRGTDGQEKVVRPNIILLDLNMPRMNGLEFLDEIRKDPELRDSIVFVLTTSNSDEDRCQAYAKNIAGYILKDNVGEGFMDAISMLNLYWKVVELPR
jgi:CheY-like chemotaxis protein